MPFFTTTATAKAATRPATGAGKPAPCPSARRGEPRYAHIWGIRAQPDPGAHPSGRPPKLTDDDSEACTGETRVEVATPSRRQPAPAELSPETSLPSLGQEQ